MNKKDILLLVILPIALCFTSCHQKSRNDDNSNGDDLMSYPISIIADTITADINDRSELYSATPEFIENFLSQVADYEGKHVSIACPMPTEWGISCVERLPEGRELWLLRSTDREWAYLVITSGFGTQRILDLIPAAVNLAKQEKAILETETWETFRQSDGSFIVHKKYEWIKNLDTNATRHAINEYQRNSCFVDRYVINDMCRFECTAVNDSVPEYSAVIFFHNSNYTPDDWDEVIPMLQAFCEDRKVYYEEVKTDFHDVAIHDFTLNEITRVDLTPYMSDMQAGMVMFKKGEQPKAIRFGSYERLQIEIKRYFKMLNL